MNQKEERSLNSAQYHEQKEKGACQDNRWLKLTFFSLLKRKQYLGQQMQRFLFNETWPSDTRMMYRCPKLNM